MGTKHKTPQTKFQYGLLVAIHIVIYSVLILNVLAPNLLTPPKGETQEQLQPATEELPGEKP